MKYETSRWRRRPALRHPRRGLAATAAGGRVYAIAGWAEGADPPFDTVEVLGKGKNNWRKAKPVPIPRANCCAATAGDRVYVFGGLAGLSEDLVALDAVHRFDPASGRWERRRSLPASRFFAGAAAQAGLLYVAGGEVDGGKDESFLAYDPLQDRWFDRTPMPAPRRSLLGLVASDKYVYAIGGFADIELGTPLSSVQRYDPTTDKWQEMAPLTRRRGNFGAAAFAEGRRILVVGGVDVINGDRPKLSTSEVYDVETDEWQLLDERLPMPRASLACAPESPETVLAIGGIVPTNGGDAPTAAVHAIHVEVSDDARHDEDRHPSTRTATTAQPRTLSRA